MVSSDPLSDDPLSLINSITPSLVNTPITKNNNRISSWTKHDLNHEPFANRSSGQNWDDDDNNVEHEVIPSVVLESISSVGGVESNVQASTSQSSDQEVFNSNSILSSTSSSSSTSKAIQIRSSSLSRERSPSTSALRGSPSSSSSSSTEPTLGISVTPRNHSFLHHSDNLNQQQHSLETDAPIDYSTTPSASNSFALKFDEPQQQRQDQSPSIYNSTGELQLEILMERIYKSIIEETLNQLRPLIEGDENILYPTKFNLANYASSQSGQTPLHVAASFGKAEIVKYLIQEAGAIVDLEDSEGETPLHRASYRGHYQVCQVLIDSHADIDAADSDGWTPLHNACSKGYLDLATLFIDAGASIDKQSNHGYTALANACSKGQLAVVQFLITKHKANPFLRNAYLETAFDLAASVFEVLICTLLANYEKNLFTSIHSNSNSNSNSDLTYNPLLSHSTIPVILHENQRLSRPSLKRLSSLGNLAVGQNPRWSSKALSLNDNRAAFTMPNQIGSSVVVAGDFVENRPVFRSEVGLPLIGNEGEFILPSTKTNVSKVKVKKGKGVASSNSSSVISSKYRPNRSRSVSASSVISETSSSSSPSRSRPKATRQMSATASLSAVLGSTSALSSPLLDSITPSNSIANSSPSLSTSLSTSTSVTKEEAWFWLSDWTIDTTSLASSPNDGWSYASNFEAPEEEWYSEPSIELLQALDGKGTLGLGGLGGLGGGKKFVRRRRWVRIMRRRLDIPAWGFIGELNSYSHSNSSLGGGEGEEGGEGEREEQEGDEEVQMEEEPKKLELKSDADYLVKALFLAGEHHSNLKSNRIRSNNSIRSGKSISRPGEKEAGSLGGDLNRNELRKAVSRLERAINELRIGTLDDEDADRRRKATDQSELYTHQLGLIKEELALHLEQDEEENSDDDDDFVYNSRDEEEEEEEGEIGEAVSNLNTRIRSGSVKSHSSYLSQQSQSPSSSSNQPLPDLTPQLSRAPEFRVPTHETSIKVQPTPIRHNLPPTSALWQSDESTSTCQDCSKQFSFFLRRHHCRFCGKVFCNSCCSNSDRIVLQQVVKEPGIPLENYAQFGRYRTCDACHLTLSQPTTSVASVTAFFPNPNSPIIGSIGTSSPLINNNTSVSTSVNGSESGQSDASELQECPVCGINLLELIGTKEVESHVQACLEVGGGAIARNGSYLVFKLPAGPLVGAECTICYIEFEIGDKLARLPCLDTFHLLCIRSWLERGKSCPFHAR